jgi:hypothetical protein
VSSHLLADRARRELGVVPVNLLDLSGGDPSVQLFCCLQAGKTELLQLGLDLLVARELACRDEEVCAQRDGE